MQQCFRQSALIKNATPPQDVAAIVTVALIGLGSALASVFLL